MAYFVRCLRSGKKYGVAPLVLPEEFDFVQLIQKAAEEAYTPPLSLDDDLGPDPFPVDDENDPGRVTDPENVTTVDEESDLSDLTDIDDDDDDITKTQHGSPTIGDKRMSHRNSKRKIARGKKRKLEPVHAGPSGKTLSDVLNRAKPLHTDLAAEELEAAKGAHTGKMGKRKDVKALQRVYDLPWFLNIGFRHIQWDGITPYPILDHFGRIIAVLCGRPNRKRYVDDLHKAFEEMMKEGKAAKLRATANQPHRRGPFPAYNVGVVMGMGSAKPVALNNKDMAPALQRLVGTKAVRRMAAFQNACLALWAPRLYEVYEKTIEMMYEQEVMLPRNFPGVFTSAAFNFGGNVWTYKHHDFFNWPFGWCFITALGRFDHTKGGQIVLWELKLVIDFPHAATVGIPSAVITHSNIPVVPGDERTSFTQYSAGPIFRWVENGFRTEEQLLNEDPRQHTEMMKKKGVAYLERVKLYSTMDELFERVAK